MSWLDGRADDGDSYLPDAVRILWPPPAQLASARQRAAPSVRRHSYLVVPSARRPKLLVPATPRRAAAAAMRGFKSTQRRRESWLLGALAAGMRVGAGAFLRDRLFVTAPREPVATDLPSYLEAALHRAVHISLHVSEPRAVRKPVLQLIDDAGRTFAFAKLGIDPFTDRLVCGEAETVGRLSGLPWRVLRLPSVLHIGAWHGHPVVVQEALSRSTARIDPSVVAAAMDELARVDGTTVGTCAADSFCDRLLSRANRLPPTPLRYAILRSGCALAESGAAAALEFGAWHGDWTPWNMNVRGGRVQVWDWEKFGVGVPVGFDAAHCFVHRTVTWGARSPADVFAELVERGEPIRAAHGVSLSNARVICWAYALTLAVTYLEDGEAEAGSAPLTRLEDWLPPTLHRAASRAAAASA